MEKKDKPKRPYLKRGERLKERRTALEKAGRLTDGTKRLAERIGVTQSAYLAYERGEYWPKGEKHRKLAEEIGWNAIELDHGPQDSGDSPEVRQLITCWGWLTAKQQAEVLADLSSKAETNKAVSKELGARWEFKSDADTAKHIKPAPKHQPHPAKKKSP